MRIGFLGKGGAGKTTFSYCFLKYLSKKFSQKIVLGVDADLNNNLAKLFNLKDYPLFFGDNAKIIFNYLFLKRECKGVKIPLVGTVPPSFDSEFIRFKKDDLIIKKFFKFVDNIGIGMIGGYTKEQIGAWCYHGRLEGLELFLHYLIDKKDDFLIFDFNQGVDVLSSSFYFSFNQYIFVVEPTLKSIGVFLDYYKTLPEIVKKNTSIKVIVNKIYDKKEKEMVMKFIDKKFIVGFVEYYKDKKDEFFHNYFEEKNKEIFERIIKGAEISNWNRKFYLEKIIELYKLKIKNEEEKQIIDYKFNYEKLF